MIKNTIYLLVFFLFCNLQAQNSQNAQKIIDNLKASLKEKPDARKTATIYSDLTWYYSNVSVDSALFYGSKAMQESQKLHDSVMIAQVYSDLGAVYFIKKDLDKSKENYLTAYKIRKARKDYNGMCKVSVNLASIYVNKNQYKRAMESYIEALNYFESVNDLDNVNTIKMNIGVVFTNLNNLPKAEKYLSEAIKYEEQKNHTDKLCMACLSMGNVYVRMNDSAKTRYYYEKSLKACTASGNKNAIGKLYTNLGAIKSQLKKYDEGAALNKKAQELKRELNIISTEQEALKLNTARDLMATKHFKEACSLLNEIRFVFERKDNTDTESLDYNQNMLVIYNLLIATHANLNQPDSVSYYLGQYFDFQQYILQKSASKQVSDLEAKYQTAKKEKQLLEQKLEARRKNILLLGISAFSFFIILISVLIYRQQKLKNRQQEQEFQLKTAISQIETQNKLQEQRLSISRDLHDNIGAQLTFIISSVDNIKHGFDIQNTRLTNKLKSISEFTKSTIIELRDTIWAMNNNAISFEDLKARILNFIEKAKTAKEEIHFAFDIDNELMLIQLTSIQGMNIYRTIQEAVNNAIKYAHPHNIVITAMTVSNKIEITVTDDGNGFDSELIESGNGLHNMKKRIEDIDGSFEINTGISKGTQIKIIIDKEY